jgi:pimeloyl-ACP methyl ester carboxylesterase
MRICHSWRRLLRARLDPRTIQHTITNKNEPMLQSELENWLSQGRRVSCHGHSIFVREEGTGEALLCLHGYPYSSWQWRRLWAALPGRYQTLAPDMLGCGYSDKPRDFNYSITAQTDLMVSLLQQLGITEVHLLAHDYGVSIAQEWLARNQQGGAAARIRSVCFLNGGLLPEKFRERMEHRLIRLRGMQMTLLFDEQAFERSIGALYGPGTRPSTGELHHEWELAARNGGLFIADKIFHFLEERIENRERWVGAMQKADVPLCLINGAADPIAGQAMLESYREIVPNSTVVPLEGIGHFPHLEAPERMLAEYHRFRSSMNT